MFNWKKFGTVSLVLLVTAFCGIILVVSGGEEVIVHAANSEQSTLIKIEKEQIKDEYIKIKIESNVRTADVLIDDQDKLPNSPDETPTDETVEYLSSTTMWSPAYNEDSVAAYIDFKTEYVITHIAFIDINGTIGLRFSAGQPFNWTNVLSVAASGYQVWKIHEITPVETQFLRIETAKEIPTQNGAYSSMSEIGLYGYRTGPVPEQPEPPNQENPYFGITADKALGSNAFINDPLDILDVNGIIREYHNLDWTLIASDENRFSIDAWHWDFDEYYKSLFEKGIIVSPCIQKGSPAVMGTVNFGAKPVTPGDDPLDPESYKIHASAMYQYAARYGSQKVDDSKLLLAADQERVSGLGYLQYYENWNEPDATWAGPESYFSPYELAAMTSADYDGHEGTLGDTYGIKNADPNAKFVMAGLARNGERAVEYLDLMKLWFEYNRQDKKIPMDVINIHAYTYRESPEEGNLRGTLEPVVAWRNANARDKEVWLTEFGWDSNINSTHAAPNNETQRDWIIRGNLITLASGIDRVTMYMIRDASWAGDPQQYVTSGLTTEERVWTKKESWFGQYAMTKALTGFEFDSIVQETEDIYIYKFINKTTGEECFALWSPTSDGSVLTDYQFDVGRYTKATLTEMEMGYYDGLKSRLKINGGKVTVDVSETPIFITLADKNGAYVAPTDKLIYTSPDMIIGVKPLDTVGRTEALETAALNIFDEQERVVDGALMDLEVAEVVADTFTTAFSTSGMPAANYPLEVYVDLREFHTISYLGFWDTNGMCDIRFYAGEPGNWDSEPFAVYGLTAYNQWKTTKSTKPISTRYVKIEKEANGVLDEIAFYGYTAAENAADPNDDPNNPNPGDSDADSEAGKTPNDSELLYILVPVIVVLAVIVLVLFIRNYRRK